MFSLPSYCAAAVAHSTLSLAPWNYLADFLIELDIGAAPAAGSEPSRQPPPVQRVVSGGAQSQPPGPAGHCGEARHRQLDLEQCATSRLWQRVCFGARDDRWRRRRADVEPTRTGGSASREMRGKRRRAGLAALNSS